MPGKGKNSCCAPMDSTATCCKLESLVSIDDRGQMVLPKELRDKAGLRAGDKLAVVSWGKAERIYCITLIKAEDFSDMVKEMLGPMAKEIAGK